MGILSEVGHQVIVMISTMLIVIIVITLVILMVYNWVIPHIHLGEIYLVDFIK